MSFAPPSWMREALCHDQDDLFFPEPATDAAIAEAKRVCYQCPVREPCLRRVYEEYESWVVVEEEGVGDAPYNRMVGWLPQTADQYGIWGGSTPAERQAVSHLPLEQRVSVLDLWLRAWHRRDRAKASEKEEVAS